MRTIGSAVIYFHSINNYRWLDRVIKLLDRLYRFVSLEEFYSHLDKGIFSESLCHIAFDDGDSSFYHTVFPLLKEHNCPASLFLSPRVVTERINYWFQEIEGYDREILSKLIFRALPKAFPAGQEYPVEAILKCLPIMQIWSLIEAYREETGTAPKSALNLSTEQLLELDASGLVSIGAHTQNHPVLRNESDEISAGEIKKSLHDLGNLLKKEITSFAYPNGVPGLDFGPRERRCLVENGVKIAFSTESRLIGAGEDLLCIPRIGLDHGNAIFILLKLITGSRWEKWRRLLLGRQEDDLRRNLYCLIEKESNCSAPIDQNLAFAQSGGNYDGGS